MSWPEYLRAAWRSRFMSEPPPPLPCPAPWARRFDAVAAVRFNDRYDLLSCRITDAGASRFLTALSWKRSVGSPGHRGDASATCACRPMFLCWIHHRDHLVTALQLI